MFFANKKEEEKIEERYILTIDGGGMRGLIPAHLISRIDELLKELKADKPLYAYFDLVAGTSTGGLIALALTSSPLITNLEKELGDDILQTYEINPLTFFEKLKGKKQPIAKNPTLITKGTDCSTLINIYKNEGKNIFKSESRIFGSLLKDKYDSKYIETFLFNTFQNAKMNQCLSPTMVVSYDASNGIPFIFNSWEDQDYYVRDAARATSAAPTYFSPFNYYDKKNQMNRHFIDGGIIANNPVLMAYSEARKLYPNCKKFNILSLSTANNEFSMVEFDINGGIMGWIDPSRGAPIQKIATSSQMQLASYVAENLGDTEYTRIHYDLKGDSFKLDDTSQKAINTLIDSAEQLYNTEKDTILKFVKKMIKRDDFTHLLNIENLQPNIKKTEEVEELPNIINNTKEKNQTALSEIKTDITPIDKQKSLSRKTIQEIIEDEANTPNIKTQGDLKYEEILEKYGYTEEEI